MKLSLPNFKTHFNSYLCFFFVALLFLRSLFFAHEFGAIEHDSGWYIGTAQRLSEEYRYAGWLSTSGSAQEGIVPGIHGRPLVQGPNGANYFSAGVTVGPGYVIPQAIIFFFTGPGTWANRFVPLAGFLLLLILSFYLLAKWAHPIAQICFFLFLYCYPQLTMQFAYEAFCEHLALAYALLGAVIFYAPEIFGTSRWQKYYHYRFFISGLALGLSYETKMLGALYYPIFALGFLKLYLENKSVKTTGKHALIWLIGGLTPILSFELYRFLFLSLSYGIDAYNANNQDIASVFKSGGGSRQGFDHVTWDYLRQITNIWAHIGITNGTFLTFFYFFISPLAILFWGKPKEKIMLLHFVWMGAGIVSWFMILSTTGWWRHYYMGGYFVAWGLFLVMGHLMTQAKESLGKVALLFIIFTFIWNGVESPEQHQYNKFFFTTEQVDKWNHQRGIAGLPAVAIYNWQEQKEFRDYMLAHLTSDDVLFYEGWLLAAEVPALLNRPQHVVGKYPEMKRNIKGRSILIFNPYQMKQNAPYRLRDDQYVENMKTQFCQEQIFSNPSYMACVLK